MLKKILAHFSQRVKRQKLSPGTRTILWQHYRYGLVILEVA